MAEYINEKDSLNTGREKINKSIQDAEEAKNISNNAESTANQALDNSESTQTQLDTIVIEGDSSVEAAQARVDADGTNYDTLKDRLDTEHTQITSQLADIAINIKSFGVVGDLINDDTNAIKSAIEHAKTLPRAVLLFPYSQGYKTLETIDVPRNVSVIMEAPIVYSENNNNPALIIRTREYCKLNVKRSTVSDWNNENSVGIVLNTISTGRVDIVESSGFTIGVQCLGDGGGFAYNQIELGNMLNNKIDVDLNNISGGWCNENLFINGRFWLTSQVDTDKNVKSYGVRITSTDGQYTNNNNVFVKPSFEKRSKSVPILIEHGHNNYFQKIRSERNSDVLAEIKNESSFTKISLGVLAGSSGTDVIDTSDNETTRVLSDNNSLFEDIYPIFSANNINKSASYYDGTLHRVQIPLFHVASTGNSNVYTAWNSFGIEEDYLSVGATVGIGRFVDTTHAKKFIIKKDVVNGYGGRINIVCYDENDNIIGNSTNKLIKGRRAVGFDWSSSHFGGSYRTRSDYDGYINISVADKVKKIRIIASGGTNELRIKSLTIFSNSDNVMDVRSWTGYEDSSFGAKTEVVKGVPLGTRAPTLGTHERGKVVYNGEPSVGDYIGWVCVEGGSPGIWKGFGLIDS